MNRLKEKYLKEVVPSLQEKYNYKSIMEVPKLEKIVINMGVGDEVVVITGSDKGKTGKILKVLRSENKVVVEGVHVVKKHQKPTGQETGGILDVEKPIAASNVMIVDPKTKKRTRIGHTTDTKTGKKIRITKKSNEKID